MKKNIFVILFLAISLISFTSGLDCWQVFPANSNITLLQKCPTCTYVNITSITYPNGTVILNEEMTKNGINFNYTLPDSSQTGKIVYSTIGDKNGIQMYEDLCIEITQSGNKIENSESINYLIIFSFFVAIIFGFYFLSHNINFEKWNNKIMKKYENKNYIKLVLSSIAYNLMKNSFVIYYILILPILLLITDIAYNMPNSIMIEFIPAMFAIYLVGVIITAIYFFGYVQEWLINSMNQLKDQSWGINGD